MTASTFGDAFMEKLSARAVEIDKENGPSDYTGPWYEDDEAEAGLTEADAATLATLYGKHNLAFAAVVQFLSGAYGMGDIEKLDEAGLRQLVREGIEAIEAWDVPEIDARTPTFPTGLQKLLTDHRDIESEIRNLLQGDLAIGDRPDSLD